MKGTCDYATLLKQAKALTEGVQYPVSNMANLAALIYTSLEGLNWAGFYLADGDRLYLGPFQGKTACTLIPFGKGVCGTAAIRDETQLVPDVHAFPGHIACDSASNAEIVIPFHRHGTVAGVLDLDSTVFGRFTEEDRAGLEALVRVLEETFT